MSLPNVTREYRSQCDGYQNLRLQSGSLSKPKATEVTIKIHAVSLQYRDLMVSKGKYSGVKSNVIPCSDGAGEIVAIGQDVKGWTVGDRVCPNFALDHVHGDVTEDIKNTGLGGQIDGVLREYINIPVHSLVRIPEHLSYEEASTLPCAALTAYNALLGPVPLKGGDYVLILGTGGVSMFGAQIAIASGATVIVTSSSDEKLQVAKKLGVQHVINYKKNDKWDEEVLKITRGRGVDHVIEVGGPNTMPKSINAARHAGWIHIIGFVSGGNNGIPVGSAIMKALTFRGILIGSVKQFEDMNRLITAREIRPVVDKIFPFEQAIEAYSYLESQKHVGKVVIKVA
ncbi:NAD(P)-binding protein [Rhizopogon vinicolor AM-OR11-026]|uniref:NAD(P)-binding protein n=1 Tax=Rhizopogon vinicolor AM-OR11-026 TaxID=1314800 RepID=A0A1B7MYN9_9AGAM|nr:NAD(P)-binding protein [Rhizopogon vinicolor AM-OR11-026]